MNDENYYSGLGQCLVIIFLVLAAMTAGLWIGETNRDLKAVIEQRCADQAYYDQLPETVERLVLVDKEMCE